MSALLASLAAGTAIAFARPWRRGPARLRSLSDAYPHYLAWQLLSWFHPPSDNRHLHRPPDDPPPDLPFDGRHLQRSVDSRHPDRPFDDRHLRRSVDGRRLTWPEGNATPQRDRVASARPRRHVAARFTAAERRRQRWASWIVASGVLLLFGVPVGLALGAAALIVVRAALGRLEPASLRHRRERISADLPLAVDLLAACLRAGRPPDEALVVVASAVRGPLGELLDQVEHRLRLGADPVDAWRQLADEPPCATLARAIQRALSSGAALAQTLEHVAADARQERRWTADERARAVETRAVVPLGLCFLPAFVLVGIVPTIAGSLSGVLSLLGQ